MVQKIEPSHDLLNPVEILQNLIRFDTTNPPGNEAACVLYIEQLLSQAGLETRLLASAPERPNLLARLPGKGEAPPVLLYGHTDVVTTAGQSWKYPPFEGLVAEGCVWGRGALDMKGGLAMMIAALLRAVADGAPPPGDILFCAVVDEENMGTMGAKFLAERHAALFEGIRYALGEFGGFTFYFGGQRFYPIMVAEKQGCWMKAIVRGPAGHGSMPLRGGAMAKAARVLQQLERRRLPVHITPPVRAMVEELASSIPAPAGFAVRQLLNPGLSNRLLDLLGERARVFEPLLHNTVSPTMISASDKINVIPCEVTLGLDGRLLPGFGPDDMLRELRQVVGDEVEIEVIVYEPGPAHLDMSFYSTLADVLRELDPQGKPLPYLLSGVTDARFFSKLGIQTYGFLPMKLPPGFNFSETIHAADERIPVEALEFGADAIYRVLQRVP